uniref:Cold shock domain containing C2 n=1 Tax=Tetraodon nigroviridis TaxID=99883 RepID=H3CH92_TETNG
ASSNKNLPLKDYHSGPLTFNAPEWGCGDPRVASSPSPLHSLDLPSPLPTKRTRTYSATVRAHSGPVFKGVCKNFSRSQGHGFIRPSNGGEDIFVHISDIEGEYVPVEGDEVTYKVSRIPPKNLKVQAVEVKITHLNPGTKHETWSGQIISS